MNFEELKQKMNILGMEVLKDEHGNNDVMVKVPMFYLDDYMEGGPHVPHPAFIVDGEIRSHFYIAKYGASMKNGMPRSLQFKTPVQGMDFDKAVTACESKGEGYHLTTNAEWSAVAMLSYFNDTLPTGNSDSGRNFNNPSETGIKANGGDVTLTGSGPNTWSTTHDNGGVMDMSGNLYEYVTGVRLAESGAIKVIKDNDASKQGINKTLIGTDENVWSGINKNGEYVPSSDPKGIKLGIDISVPRGHGNPNRLLSKVTNTMSDTYLMKSLGLLPFEEGNAKQDNWFFLVNETRDRVIARGGAYNSVGNSGIYAIQFIRATQSIFGYRFSYIS